MKYYKVNNLINNDGSADYKGLDISLIKAGSQFYPDDLSFGIIGYLGGFVKHEDLDELTEIEYRTYF